MAEDQAGGFRLSSPRSPEFTDDTVLTIAVAHVLLHGGSYADAFRRWGMRYPLRELGRDVPPVAVRGDAVALQQLRERVGDEGEPGGVRGMIRSKTSWRPRSRAPK